MLFIRHFYTIYLLLLLVIASSSTLAETKKILVLGDSLSAAYRMPKEQGWVNLLRQRVKPEWQVINGAVSGATTAQGLSLLPGLLKQHQPEILILELGGNDGLQGKPIKHITQNLEKLVLQAKQAGATVVLLGIRIPSNFGSRYTEPFFQQYKKIAKKHGLAYHPFLLEGVATNKSLMMNDGIHPKAAAQPKILENVWAVLKPELKSLE